MSWERDPLWAKARLYFERAFAESPDDPRFGLWCSLGLELLARAALASVSPTLLAEPFSDHRFLLVALNRGSEKTPRRSIHTAQVLDLCAYLFDGFSKDDKTAAMALVNRRNDELHTGASAFDEYPSKLWLTGFYRICYALTDAMGESLDGLFGAERGKAARRILDETQNEVKQQVLGSIAAHRKVFDLTPEADRRAAAERSEKEGARLAYERHHRVTCPACGSVATVQGEPIGQEHVTHKDDGSIEVRQTISPRTFSCSACSLTLKGYAELDAAQLGGDYTRTTEYSPEDYYGLVSPESIDEEKIIEAYLEEQASDAAFDNE